VYPDNFQDSIKNYLELTGQVDGGVKISSNTEVRGRFHTEWLNMIFPRLKIARTLLISPLKNSRALHLSPIDCVHIVS